MAINIRGYANEELNELIKTQEELEKCIKEYDYQIKTNTTKWNIEDAKTHRLHLRKAFKNDILSWFRIWIYPNVRDIYWHKRNRITFFLYSKK